MYNPDNGWRPWPEPCSYDPEWVDAVPRGAGRARRADRRDREGVDRRVDRRREAAAQRRLVDATRPAWRELRRRTVFTKYLTIYRTLADPAYLDLSIDPDDRPMGSLFAFPDPLDANYGRGGLARVMTARGWLSTWSGLSSHAKLADTMPQVTVPTILVHPTADSEIRVRQAKEIVANAGAADVTYVEMKGAPHYLEGHRPEAMRHRRRLAGDPLPLSGCAHSPFSDSAVRQGVQRSPRRCGAYRPMVLRSRARDDGRPSLDLPPRHPEHGVALSREIAVPFAIVLERLPQQTVGRPSVALDDNVRPRDQEVGLEPGDDRVERQRRKFESRHEGVHRFLQHAVGWLVVERPVAQRGVECSDAGSATLAMALEGRGHDVRRGVPGDDHSLQERPDAGRVDRAVVEQRPQRVRRGDVRTGMWAGDLRSRWGGAPGRPAAGGRAAHAAR